MLTLAQELIDDGKRIVVTTTTKMADYEMHRINTPISIDEDHPPDPNRLTELLDENQALFLYNDRIPGKVRGLSVGFIEGYVVNITGVDFVLIEADGSRQLPFKAMHAHEPVIPDITTHVVYVTGINILDQPMDEFHVYGIDRIGELISPNLPELVTESWVAAVILNPDTGLTGIPHGCPVTVMINKVEQESILRAEKLADLLLIDTRISSVLIGSAMNSNAPIIERRNRVGVVLLAAGISERMGTCKMLLDWHGTPLIAHIARQIKESLAFITVVITGGGDNEAGIRAALKDYPLLIIQNPLAASNGMVSSVQQGIKTLDDLAGVCLILHGDLPFITSEIIDSAIKAYWHGDGKIIIPTFNGRHGHPVLFDRCFWPAICDLSEGKSPREVVISNEKEVFELQWGSDAVIFDLDTREQYEEALRRALH